MQFTGDQPLECFMLDMASNDNNVIKEANDNISKFLLNPNMLEVVSTLLLFIKSSEHIIVCILNYTIRFVNYQRYY